MDASFAQVSFLGGAWCRTMQGRFDRPDYRTAMNVCLNGLPTETGAWTRRPGEQFAQTTRSGAPGRVITFSFEQATPYTLEFTSGHLRAFNQTSLVTTNDTVGVTSISTANPAKVTVPTAVTWLSGDQVFFNNLTVATPKLMNRLFIWTKVLTTTGTLTDAITGATIDGSTLGTLPVGVTISRVLDVATPFVDGVWPALRSVQAERQSILLSSLPPQVLTATVNPAPNYASFALVPANFVDGPYLDPFTNGVLATPSAKTGVITITLAFNAYSASKAYSVGDFVTSSSVNYESLVDQNVGNTPASSPTQWAAVSAGLAIGPNGFTGNDVGRHIRLFSEPPLWVVGGSYTAGNVVGYVDSTGAKAYYTCLTNNTGALTNAPGVLLADWGVNAAATLWSWGKIVSLSSQISQSLASSTSIGDMTNAGAGSLANAFDGIIGQAQASCTAKKGSTFTTGNQGPNTLTGYVGKNYSAASDQAIASGTIFPSTDLGFFNVTSTGSDQANINGGSATFTVNLRAKASAPSTASDGTLLGTSGNVYGQVTPITVVSSDTATAWKYVWFEIIAVNSVNVGGINFSWTQYISVAEAQFFNPPGTGTATGVNLQLIGPDLLYTTSITTWRLGLFSASTGYPACGTYHEGRLWLSGIVSNRLDASRPNSLFNFAPTEADGTVTDANAIDYTLDGPDVNPIFWLTPDQQGIIVGTQAGEWLVQASSLNSPLTPTSMQAHRVTTIGCANIEPRRTEHTMVFVQKFKKKVMEYFADVFSGKFSAPNLTLTAKHFGARGLEEIAYQQELAPVIWARCTDGSLIGATYKRDSLTSSQGPTFIGWHEHTLGSGRTVESICTGPSTDGLLDTLAMVTNDAATGIRHVSFLTNLWEEGAALSTAWHLDDAVTPSATQTVTVNGTSVFQLLGLWHLVGKTVTVFAGGLDVGDYLVAADGTLNVSFGSAGGLFTSTFVSSFTSGIPVVAGFTFTSRGQLLRPATPQDSGARNGPAFGKKRRIQPAMALLQDTQGIYIGTNFATIRLAQLKTDGETLLTALQVKSGVWRDQINDDNNYDSMLCWEIRRPYPSTVVVMGGLIETKDA